MICSAGLKTHTQTENDAMARIIGREFVSVGLGEFRRGGAEKAIAKIETQRVRQRIIDAPPTW